MVYIIQTPFERDSKEHDIYLGFRQSLNLLKPLACNNIFNNDINIIIIIRTIRSQAMQQSYRFYYHKTFR